MFPLLQVYQSPHPGSGVVDVEVALHRKDARSIRVSLSSIPYDYSKTEYRAEIELIYLQVKMSEETTLWEKEKVYVNSTSLEEVSRVCADALASEGVTF